MSYIQLQGGRKFDFLNPDPASISLEDIARALSKLCRFTGHTNRFYSVAEHSVRVSNMVPDAYARAGLMHDASEAFVGDVASPLKHLLPEYKIVEQRVWEAVAERFGLGEQAPGLVKDADQQIVVNEAHAFGLDPSSWTGFPKADMRQVVDIVRNGGWSEGYAFNRFMERAEELNVR